MNVGPQQKLLATDPLRLPPAVRERLMVQPLWSLPVNPVGDRFELAQPGGWRKPAPQPLFPKLAVKTWRDAHTLGVVYDGMPMATILNALLERPTRAQRIVARAWQDAGEPLLLHLYPYVDFSAISEVRFLAGPHELRLVSQCERGPSAALLPAALPLMRAQALQCAAALPPRSHLLDFACLADGQVRLVEVNPGLTPADLVALRRAAGQA